MSSLDYNCKHDIVDETEIIRLEFCWRENTQIESEIWRMLEQIVAKEHGLTYLPSWS